MFQSSSDFNSGPGGMSFETDIAVVGMSCRFPGARNIDEYWSNLRNGIESVTRYSDEELLAAGVNPRLLKHPDYVKAGAPMPDMEMFDAALFGLSPRDAAIMDPQHRHFLQCAWAALEDAGHVPGSFPGSIGVFAGSGHNAYLPYNLLSNPDLVRDVGFFLLRHTGNDKDFLTTRVSYLLDLKGPSVNVQTACSTSLVAIHMAVQSLLNSESDMALAGGVTIELPHRQGYLYEQGEILAPDGHCRAFDAEAAGTLFGSGAGAVVLRRLSDAISDGDHVYAVIKGSAANNDGVGKVSYLAPSVDGQARVISEALSISNVTADSIDYVETHGTGTPVGDPIEVAALTQAFRHDTNAVGYCAIGSVKPNIGHTDTAAGVASFMKVALALHQREIPPSLNHDSPNPACDFGRTPFHVNTALRPWKRRNGMPRRAGVSSLGVGGTNCHAILQEAPLLPASGPSRRQQLLMLSAATPGALDENSKALAGHFRREPDQKLADAAYTLQVGRTALRHRRVLVAASTEDAAAKLEVPSPPAVHTSECLVSDRKVGFLFPGAGPQHPGMAYDLYQTEPVFRDALDECLDILKRNCALDIRDRLYPPAAQERDAQAAFERPSISLPALFAVQYAAAKLWLSWGIEPEAMIGHSMGEYAAAHFAGVFDLPSALQIVCIRSRLFESLPEGRMLSVPLGEEELRPLLGPDLSIAAINGRKLTIASGPIKSIEKLERTLGEQGIEAQMVRTPVAAHSSMLDPVLEDFRKTLRSIVFNPPDRPFISSLTGDWISKAEATDPEYWVRHLRQTVRFADGLERLMRDEQIALLDIGPGRSLASLARQHPARSSRQPVFNGLPHPDEKADDQAYALTVLGRLWAAGVDVPWARLWEGEDRRRVSLPTYCFERQRHWIEPGLGAACTDHADDGARRTELDEWFYEPIWHRTSWPSGGDETPGSALVFLDDGGTGEALAARLRARGCRVATVSIGGRFRETGFQAYQMRPAHEEDYRALFLRLGFVPEHIYHLWLVTAPDRKPCSSRTTDKLMERGFYSLFHLARALGEQADDRPIGIALVTDRAQRVLDEEHRAPAKAAAIGALRVIPQEMPHVRISCIDVESSLAIAGVADALIAELSTLEPGQSVAWRGHERWEQRIETLTQRAGRISTSALRPGGAYLITGGLGGIGLRLARHLTRNWGARVALIGRSVPPRADWDRILEEEAPGSALSRRIHEFIAMEERDNEILLLQADVSDATAMRRAVATARKRFGTIDGVFHTAGLLDDGPLQLKGEARAGKVLAPKIAGTLALEAALGKANPDFIMLFSSVSAFAGLPGQFDYAAANAFLDAYARSHQHRSGPRIISAGWTQWEEIGMAAALADGSVLQHEPPLPSEWAPFDHPFFDHIVLRSEDEYICVAVLSPESHWLLDDHRLSSGQALIPGAAYLEIVRAAYSATGARGPVELRELAFPIPFAVEDGGKRELRVRLTRHAGDMWRFSVLGRRAGNPADEGWIEHAHGFIAPCRHTNIQRLDTASILTRCPEQLKGAAAAPSAAQLRLGPRWQNVDSVHVGTAEALIELHLDASFQSDLDHIGVHPALLDFATAGAQMLVPGFDPAEHFFAPASYGRIRLMAELPSRIVSHVRLRLDGDPESSAVYDVTISDENGRILAQIEAFTMIRVHDAATLGSVPGPSHNTHVRGHAELGSGNGIRPSEGMAVIERILATNRGAHVIISPQHLDGLLKRMHTPRSASTATAGPNAFAGENAPRTTAERLVASLWTNMLGIAAVQRNSDFFELGGHSLLAVQFINRLRKESGKSLPLAALVEAPTVAQLAALIEPPTGEETEDARDARAPVTPAVPGLVLLRPGEGGPPLFLVHDGLGETLLYRTLAMQMDPRHAVYGLQPESRGDRAFVHTRIDEMACAYANRIRVIQPEGPYLLAGLCAGGVIAFEMARQLQDAGFDVRFTGIIDAADVDAAERPFYVTRSRLRRIREVLKEAACPARLLQIAPLLLGKIVNAAAYEIGSRLDRLRKQRAVDRMREGSAGNGKEEPNLSFLQLYEVAHRQHRPQGLLSNCRVILFRAMAGNGAADDIPFREQYSDCILGWGKRVAEEVRLVEIPGGHTSCLQEPNVGFLAEAMQTGINEALGHQAAIKPQRRLKPVPSVAAAQHADRDREVERL